MFKSDLYEHPLVVRLCKNRNWKPAADAAVDYFIEGKECPIASFKKSCDMGSGAPRVRGTPVAAAAVFILVARLSRLRSDAGHRACTIVA